MPAVAEVIGSWTIAWFRLVHYGFTAHLLHLQSTAAVLPSSSTYTCKKWIPLVTQPRIREQIEESVHEIHEQVLQHLKQHQQLALDYSSKNEQLVELIRSNTDLRRLVSRLMVHSDSKALESLELFPRIQEIWPQLLSLPCMDDTSYQWSLSLVLPAYRERGATVAHTLRCALEASRDSAKIQVIIVDAGLCTDLESELDRMQQQTTSSGSSSNNNNKKAWGQVKVVAYPGRGGRGPTLNCGANVSDGEIITFLHSDTLLPVDWDIKVQDTLRRPNKSESTIVHACAFSFGTNLSKQGLEGMGYPWGIQAVHFSVRLRTERLKLPYGDNVISIPAAYFHYVGGFPDQSIMEDYSLMDYLRTRARVLPEQLVIIPNATVRKRQCKVILSVSMQLLTPFNVCSNFYRLCVRPEDGKSLVSCTRRWPMRFSSIVTPVVVGLQTLYLIITTIDRARSKSRSTNVTYCLYY
jgi:glycosyltransferase involved in cell wall biosynthesis